MARFTINGGSVEVTVAPGTPLLWAIREQVGRDHHQHLPVRDVPAST
jgi:aerobic-type carbon monoxide dehydrogenase small subunit (CoxS/CutS family)